MTVAMTGQARVDLHRQASMRDWATKIGKLSPTQVDAWITWLEGHDADEVCKFTLAASLRVWKNRQAAKRLGVNPVTGTKVAS